MAINCDKKISDFLKKILVTRPGLGKCGAGPMPNSTELLKIRLTFTLTLTVRSLFDSLLDGTATNSTCVPLPKSANPNGAVAVVPNRTKSSESCGLNPDPNTPMTPQGGDSLIVPSDIFRLPVSASTLTGAKPATTGIPPSPSVE